MMRDPIWVYDNWSAYTDGLANGLARLDDTRLTEALAMKQLGELIRLKQSGVHFDYYMMNAFWFAPEGAYRTWRQPDWPDGPDRWIDACRENGLKPGLWFGANSLLKYQDGWRLNVAPQWRDSLAHESTVKPWQAGALSFYEGGFLNDFMETLQYWYDRGIRLFEMDFVNFDAATLAAHREQSPAEIRENNETAFRNALRSFRLDNPEAILVAFNGFGGDQESTAAPFPFRKPVDLRWLEVFDTLYSGDVRVSDVPLTSFWRSVDLYNDHMVRRYEQSGVPLERIDPFFTLSTTWFGYNRGKQAWKAALLLTAARGSWKQTIYGGLDLLSDEDARWFAKVQSMFAPLLAMGRTKSFGGIPGRAEPYGFGSFDGSAALYTVVNPAQQEHTVTLPTLSGLQSALRAGRILFRDAGFAPSLEGAAIKLGAGQMAVIGFGRYATPEHDLGIEQDVIIPCITERLDATLQDVGPNAVEATLTVPAGSGLRIIVQQRSQDGAVARGPDLAGSPEMSREERQAIALLPMDRFIHIEARQNGREIAVQREQAGKVSIPGISWGAGEIQSHWIGAGQPLTIRCVSMERKAVRLEGRLYAVEY